MKSNTTTIVLIALLCAFSSTAFAQTKKKQAEGNRKARISSRADTNGDGKIDERERAELKKRRLPVRRGFGRPGTSGPIPQKPETKKAKSKGSEKRATPRVRRKKPTRPIDTTGQRKHPKAKG